MFKTDFLYDQAMSAAGVSSLDELRTLSTGQISQAMSTASLALQGARIQELALNDPGDGTLPERLDLDAPPDQPYAPVVGNSHLQDQVVYMWRNGHIKKNAPVAWSISKVFIKMRGSSSWGLGQGEPPGELGYDLVQF